MSYLLKSTLISALAGCVSSGPVEFRPEGQASNTRSVLNCELKNGPTGCTDMRIKAANDYYAALESDYESTPARNLQMAKVIGEGYDLLTAKREGKAYEPPGGRPFTPFNDIALRPVTPATPVESTATSGGTTPQPGTWYCDNLTGSGNYGTWEMTQHPEQFDVSSCKRVD